MKRWCAVLLSVFVTLLLSHRAAWADTPLPTVLDGIGIEERPGARVPLDVRLRDQSGAEVALGRYFDGQPVILVLAYYECPMLCTLVLNGIQEGMSELAWTAGKQYRVLTVSFDPRDTPEAASRKRANYLKSYGRDVGPQGWDFLVGDEAQVRRLAEAVGFHYRWDEETKQFAHATGAFVLTPDGRLSRTLYGVTFSERNLRLALLEASEGKLGAAWDRVQLYCYHYDAAARSYVISPVQVMKLGGAATMATLGTVLLMFWRREVRRARAERIARSPAHASGSS
jgi:protein SCO1